MAKRCKSDMPKPATLVCSDRELALIRQQEIDDRPLQERADIEEMLQEATARCRDGGNYPGLSYEQGVEAALAWVLGADDNPLID